MGRVVHDVIDRMRSLQRENWRLTELVIQHEATIKQQQHQHQDATIDARRNGSALPYGALLGPQEYV